MKIYCSGIGGIGLSAYAALQKAAGHEVMGSDRHENETIADLRRQGIEVFMNQNGSCLPTDCDLFVYSEAIPQDALERVKARECGIPSKSYFHALGEITQNSFVIAVCGTHGKSSTTAMVSKMFIDAGKDPSVVVGTKMKELGGRNWRKGSSNIFVVEACEYRRSFHFLSPDLVLLTNVDGDHFDAFHSIDDYHEAFITFLKRLPQEGLVIMHGRDPQSVFVASESGKIAVDADQLSLPAVGVPGLHMRQNGQLVMAAAHILGVDEDIAEQSLKTFTGTWRRMEVKGTTTKGAIVVDDYGHHPVEIMATLSAMREAYPDQRIICVFQPHTHDRTLKLYDEFTHAFTDADIVVIPNVYNARHDIETGTVNIPAFISDISLHSDTEVIDGTSITETYGMLQSMSKPGDVIITMGAGDITQLADMLIAA